MKLTNYDIIQMLGILFILAASIHFFSIGNTDAGIGWLCVCLSSFTTLKRTAELKHLKEKLNEQH
jgi:hypothetical protein